MKIVGVNFFCLTALACLKMLRTEAIVSTKAEEKKDERKGDSQVSQTTNREYAEAYDESYDSGHLGLSAHALYGREYI
ncbi:hypothetical protein RUM43_014055 [Polyplax serrata]|uniref:Uncharacterized protein n=1 Tax=Polyplax serrata TaxID=468196 RepID=A0AAN8P1P2_POLSC